MKAGFFIIAFTLLLSINVYVVVRGWQALPAVSFFRPAYLCTMILLFLSMFVGMIFGSAMPAFPGKAISLVGYTYMIVFIYLFLSFLIVDVVRIANHFIHFAPSGMASFRLWAFIATIGGMALALIIGNIKFNSPKVVELHLQTSLPVQHKTVRILVASDLHLGVTTDKHHLKKYVKLINAKDPDIVLFAGDVSDRDIAPIVRQRMDEELRQIKAPLGVFAINGNHEHYAETPTATAEYLTKAGIRVLRDETCLVDNSFYIIGREDRSNANRKGLAEIVKGLDDSKPKILIDHQPFHLEEAEQSNIDLQVSGHTHQGQFFPGNLFVKSIFELPYGYKKKGNTHYYVSSGLSLWGPPYRIGTQSEIVVINLGY